MFVMLRSRRQRISLLLLLPVFIALLNLWHAIQEFYDDEVVRYSLVPTARPHHKQGNETAQARLNASIRKPWTDLSTKELSLLASAALHPLSRDEPYARRINGIRSKCEKQRATNPRIDLSRLIYDDRHKVVMCEIPKAACTTWKEIMWYLLRKVRTLDDLDGMDRNILTLSRGNLPTLDKLDRDEAIRRLTTYTTFFVKRHPLQRILSAYKNKFTKKAYNDVYKLRDGRKIALSQAEDYMQGVPFNRTGLTNVSLVKKDQTFRTLPLSKQEEVLRYVAILNSGEIGFEQLVRSAAEQNENNPENLDVHWRSQVLLCNPCAISYDYVIDFDDLGRDSNRLLDYLQRDKPDEPRSRLKQRNASANQQSTSKAFSSLGRSTVDGLKKVYRDDFYILNYE